MIGFTKKQEIIANVKDAENIVSFFKKLIVEFIKPIIILYLVKEVMICFFIII